MLQAHGGWCFPLLALTLFFNDRPGMGAVLSIAHRGNSLFAPENTLAAFGSACDKADIIETDARLSADGRLVIMHDNTVDRTTDGTGTVASKTVAELQALDAGSWFLASFAGERIPTLQEMLNFTLPFAPVLLEQKDGSASVYVSELRRLGALDGVILQSFDWNFLTAVHALEPGLRLGALGNGTLNAATLATIVDSGASYVAWEKASVTSNEVSLVHGAGLPLFVWTVDGAEIKNFIDLGVDGIISNDPGLVQQLQQPQTIAPAELGESLVAYWNFDDGLEDSFATIVADRKGTNSGTLVRNDGASHWFGAPLAQLGGCLKLEGTNAFVTLPQTRSLDIGTNQLTLSVWVRLPALPSQLPTSYGAIFDSTTDCYVLYLDKANKELRFKVTDANSQAARPGIPEAQLRTNEWLHVAAIFNGTVGPVSGQATIYLDGRPKDVHTGSDSTAPTGLSGSVKPGQAAAMGREGPAGGNYFTGCVDDFAIWRRALSPAEVSAVYAAGKTGLSLADLLRTPTALLQPDVVTLSASGIELNIEFANLGPWTSFRLLRASHPSGPFLAVPGTAPVSLGGERYRFVVPLTSEPQMFYRIEGY